MPHIFVTTLLATTMLAAPVLAQTTAPTPPTAAQPSSNQGTFDSLPPGEQKIAQALFNAETANTSSTSPKLSRDDIAAMKKSGKGWGEIFQEMKTQGLVQEKNLGQVVSKFSRSERPSSPEMTGTPGRGQGTPGGFSGPGRGMTGTPGRGQGMPGGSSGPGRGSQGGGRGKR